MAPKSTERVYTFTTAPEHPVAAMYGISERQFRRWVQAKRISYVKPGSRVLFTSDDIEQAILGTRVEREVQP